MTWNPDYNPPTAQRTSKPLPRLASETTADNPWPVSLLSEKFYTAVERWPSVWVAGQITQINTRRQGSAYITLRDDQQDIAMEVNGFGRFAAAAAPFVQGDRVIIHGKPNVWMKRTSLSLRGDAIIAAGAGGSLKAMIDELRKKLKGEGLFDADRKKPLPEFPHCIGLICAPQARAEGDVITNVRLRWPVVGFKVTHVHVQGEQCPSDVVAAIRQLDADPDVDVIIVARGGGAFEDLIGFSDENVVRAAAAAARLAADLTRNRTAAVGVVRHRGWSGLSADDLSKITRCQILGELGHIPRLARVAELGGLPERLPGALTAAARLVLADAGVPL